MSVDIENIAVIVAPLDTYTAEKDDFIDAINGRIKNSVNVIYVDCEQLLSITSSHVSLLWEALQLCEEQNIQFKLRNVSNGIHEVFKVLDIDGFFKLDNGDFSSIEENKTSKISVFTITPYDSDFCPNVENIVREKLNLDKYLKQIPITHEIIYEIETIFYEVVTNIRRHGQIKASDTIKFSISQMNDSVVLRFIDCGIEFDLTKYDKNYKPSQAIKDRMKDGLGILMIKKMANSVLYERKDGKNILTVTKTWSKCNGK